MTKSEFKALEKVLTNLGRISHVGIPDEQRKQLTAAYDGIWNVLTEDGQESLASMALRLNIK